MQEIIQHDRTLFLYLNNLGDPAYDPFWLMVSGTWVWVPLYVIFLYLIYKKYGRRNIVFVLIFVLLGVTVSDQLSNIFKMGIMRLRPCHNISLSTMMRAVKCGGLYGFYSAHASNTFFIATFMISVLGRVNRFFSLILVFWAMTVSYSRIYLGVHFPLDILMGAIVGILLGGFFSALTKNTITKLENNRIRNSTS